MENLIKSLGEPIDGNEYIIIPINGEWWIEHKHVGSGEPLIQWLEAELRQPPVSGSVCDNCGKCEPMYCAKCYRIADESYPG